MSNCVVSIAIAGETEPITINVDSDNKSLEEISGLLYSENGKDILDSFRSKLERSIGKKIKLTPAMLEGQIVGNCNMGYLKTMYPNAVYPNSINTNVNILLYDSAVYKGIPISSGVLKTNNGLTYIIPNNEYAVQSFLDYNIFIDKSINDPFISNLLDELAKGLPSKIKDLDIETSYLGNDNISRMRFIYDYFFKEDIRNELKNSKIKFLPEDILNNEKTKALGVTKNSSIHQAMNNIYRFLVHDGTRLENDEVVNNLVSIIDNNKKGKYKRGRIVTYDQLVELNNIYNLAKINDPNVDKIAFMTEVIAMINSKDSNLKFEIDKVLNDSIILNSNIYYKKIQDYPSFGLNDLGNSVEKVENYSGYNIYKINNDNTNLNGSYLISNKEFNYTTQLNTFGSLEDARKGINKRLKDEIVGSIDYLSITGKNKTFTANSFSVDSVIRAYSPIAELEGLSCISLLKFPRYKSMLGMNITNFKNTYKEQLKIENSNLLVDNIESIQDAQLVLGFLYTNSGSWLDAINKFIEIKNSENPINRYIISKTTKNNSKKGNKLEHKIIPLGNDESTVINEKTKRPQSIINVLNNLSGILSKRFGIQVHNVDDEFVKNMFPDKNMYSIKAFVYNGEVYINMNRASPSDTVHEFMHLALGLMKFTNSDSYMSLLEKVSNSNKFKEFKRNPIYSNRAQSDILEETVVSIIGDYVEEQMFNINEFDKNIDLNVDSDEINNLTKCLLNVFDSDEGAKNLSFRRIVGSQLIELFDSFKKEEEEPLFNKESNKDLAKDARTISNIIENGIESNEIKEDCYGM